MPLSAEIQNIGTLLSSQSARVLLSSDYRGVADRFRRDRPTFAFRVADTLHCVSSAYFLPRRPRGAQKLLALFQLQRFRVAVLRNVRILLLE